MKRSASTSLENATTCPVCCDKFTGSTRRRVACANCDFAACLACNRQYLVGLDEDPKCMQCNFAWSRSFLDASFPKAFVDGDFAKAREQVLLDRERAQLPDSQHLVANYELSKQLKKTLDDEKRERETLAARIAQIDTNRYALTHRLHRIKYTHYQTDGRTAVRAVNDDGTDPGPTGYAFVCQCPVPECRGFVDSEEHRCGICKVYACKKCREVVGETPDAEHECDPEILKTVELLRKDSKPCPSCGVVINKLSGCDQMFCTNCRTPFSWKTGRVVTRGPIHNPHYFEFVRNNPGEATALAGRRNEEHAECGGRRRLPYADELYRLIGSDLARGSPSLRAKRSLLYDILRDMHHTREVALAELRSPRDHELLDLRRKFLAKEIDEAGWRRALVLRERRREKIQNLRDLYDMALDVSTDVYATLGPEEAQMQAAIDQLTAVFRYATEQLDKICKRYSCNPPVAFADIETNLEKYITRYTREDEEAVAKAARNVAARPIDLSDYDSDY